jgi:hypothetical protein
LGGFFRAPIESRVTNLRLADFFIKSFFPDFLLEVFRRFFTISNLSNSFEFKRVLNCFNPCFILIESQYGPTDISTVAQRRDSILGPVLRQAGTMTATLQATPQYV